MNTPDWQTTCVDIDASAFASALPVSTIVYDPIVPARQPTEVSLNGDRWYEQDGEYYPSVTTMLKATDTEGRDSLKKWRDAVGDEMASSITNKAVARGLKWHKFCEQYLMGDPVWSSLTSPGDTAYAGAIARLLNERVKTVVASELRVISPTFGLAGRVDIAAELHDGRTVIIDFKTGRKPKYGQRVDNYAIQTTIYADALSALVPHGPIDTVVIVQLCPQQLLWQETSVAAWSPIAAARVVQFAHIVQTTLNQE